MRIIRVVQQRSQIAGELLAFFWLNKRWWALPMVVILLFFGVLLALAHTSAIAPFIYTLF